jgi:hypothetical protein
MSVIEAKLRELGSYDDLASFAARFGDDWQALFEQCPRGDWLLALAARLGADRRALTLAAISCAREALTYLPTGDATLEAALASAGAWAAGRADEAACREAAARVAALPPQADAVADMAVQAVAAALTCPHEPPAAAHAAACAAQAAVLAAGDCAMTSALRFTQERCAGLARQQLSSAELARLARAT